MKIYTLELIKTEAELIAGCWNGSDDRFIDGNGDNRTDEEAALASDLLTKVEEIEQLIKTLGI